MKLFTFVDNKVERLLNKLRIQRLKMLGAIIGEKTRSYGRFKIIGNCNNLKIGNNVTINECVLIVCHEQIEIGSDVHLSAFSQLHTGQLTIDSQKRTHLYRPIKIGNNVWIASGVIIQGGITIGNNSVIGAGSVVLKDVESNCFYAGVPAKKIRVIIPLEN